MTARPPVERNQAKRRHPAGSWQPDTDRFWRCMAQWLATAGCERPELVAAVLKARAGLGLDQAQFAELLDVDPAVIDHLEDGVLPPGPAPAELAHIAPGIDWAALW